ncbi:hypothetical protein [Halomicronema sp. CCY15110]|uniref:hypothetical protein n=1 Tax=Halomicronema sp. CCY15110 TaxID=2767773 RepID=UPI0019525680|nr:hypothetical protein [Halomicronema sp. CCY15110]
MSSLEPEELSEMLVFLKSMRQKLLADFLSQEREVFIPMFAYENEPVSMDIAIEKYFLGWLNEHFSFLSEESDDYKEAVRQAFLVFMSSLIQEHIKYKQKHLAKKSESFVFPVLRAKIDFLESLLNVSANGNKKYNELLFAREKDRALFQRQLDKLQEQS